MLNQETIDRIEKEADKYAAKYLTTDKRYLAIEVYKDVATAEATRALEREKVLVEASRFLNEKIDEMWNECNTMPISERHKAAIISAQRKLYASLASYRGEKEENQEPEMGSCGDCGRATNNYLGNQYYQCDECAQKEVGNG
jgi:hypothetical protein